MKHRRKRISSERLVGASCEALESRTLFDLACIGVDETPTHLIAGVKTNEKVIVQLHNTGGETISGKYTLTLFASSDSFGDTNDGVITTLHENLAPLKADGFTSVNVALGTFTNVPTGTYYIAAALTGSLTNPSDSTTAGFSQVAVTDPFVNLTGTSIFKGTTSVKPGGAVEELLTITNGGNVVAAGKLTVGLSLSSNSNGLDPVEPSTYSFNVKIEPGESTTLTLKPKIPVGNPLGSFSLVASVDHSDTLTAIGSDITDSTVVSGTSLTVLSPFPDVSGTLTGTFKIISGTDKGLAGTSTLDVTELDGSTGAFSGTISNSLDGNVSDNISGSVITTGSVMATITSMSSGDELGSFSGKFSNGKLTGNFKSISGSVSALVLEQT
jgi:hypothetical protein